MAELFGFQITRVKKTEALNNRSQQREPDDGTTEISGGDTLVVLDMEGTAKSEAGLIRRYREISLHPECDMLKI